MMWALSLFILLQVTALGLAAKLFLSPLASHLKANVDPDVTPQPSPDVPVPVLVLYSLLNIAEVDHERNQVEAEIMVYHQYYTGAVWDPSAFNGVDVITLPAKYVWTPPLRQLTSGSEARDIGPHLITLFSNGTGAYVGVYRDRYLCDVSNIASGAHCNPRFTVWGYTKDQVNIIHAARNPLPGWEYFPGSKFEITHCNYSVTSHPFATKEYQVVDHHFTVREKPQAHGHGHFRALFQWY